MAVKIIGLIIGLLVLGAGIYYLAKEKHDPESKKIYSMNDLLVVRQTGICQNFPVFCKIRWYIGVSGSGAVIGINNPSLINCSMRRAIQASPIPS